MRTLICCLFLSTSLLGYAQNITVSYNSVMSGRNLTATYDIVKNNHEFNMGLGLNINCINPPNNQASLYANNLYAIMAFHFINVNFSYQYRVLHRLKNIQAFVFYDLQAKYAPPRNEIVSWTYPNGQAADNAEQSFFLHSEEIEHDPVTWLENTVGIGYKVNVTDKIYLKNKLGLGVTYLLGYDWRLTNQTHEFDRSALRYDYLFGGIISVGVGYSFSN
jgi:hypothetical protein